ncbi:MAG: sodium ion-translocating decarboxylase subunit beta [Dehalococcoidales bacterium]|nr:MAG: sodium ion-translocating decarboxylase subunit beta [Dehalococcoidales bacterium]
MDSLFAGFTGLTWANAILIIVALVFIYLGIAKKWEPYELIPIGVGLLLANLPNSGILIRPHEVGGEIGRAGLLGILIEYSLLRYTILPQFIFLGLGAMQDFGPLLANPKLFLLGGAAQIGIVVAFFGALALGHFGIADFGIEEAACIGIIGGADGPTTIFLTSKLSPEFMGVTAVAAYSYMAMVAIIQPPIIRALTSKKERQTYMKPQIRNVSRLERILFPIVSMILTILLVPYSAPLVGMFMFGNLLKECGVVDRLSDTAANAIINGVTIVLMLCIGASMPGELVARTETLLVLALGLIAFASGTAGGVIMGKIMSWISKEPINPMIGAAGVSAVPMASRVVQHLGQKENPRNFLLMHAMAPNVAGVIGSAVVAGVFLTLISG